jgi:DNA-binding transcriptional MerR regulator
MAPKLYKAAEVCEITQLQPYVLRSWEKEFPGIGVRKSPDSAPLYRQSDVDYVLRIKQLVFGEGLTLAGAWRRLEGAPPPAPMPLPIEEPIEEPDETPEAETLGADARATIDTVRKGLRGLLDALSQAPGSVDIAHAGNGRQPVAAAAEDDEDEYELSSPPVTKSAPPKARAIAARGKQTRAATKPTRRTKAKRSKVPSSKFQVSK